MANLPNGKTWESAVFRKCTDPETPRHVAFMIADENGLDYDNKYDNTDPGDNK